MLVLLLGGFRHKCSTVQSGAGKTCAVCVINRKNIAILLYNPCKSTAADQKGTTIPSRNLEQGLTEENETKRKKIGRIEEPPL